MLIEKNIIPRTLEEFNAWEDPEDGFKYEWNDGELIKFAKNKAHLKLIRTLNRLFLKTEAHHLGGELIAKSNVSLTESQIRRPDFGYFSYEQIEDASNDIGALPEFIIEVIAQGDTIGQYQTKIIEYFKAEVKVVWLIFPEKKSVHVYTSRRDVKICIENDICSAAPVLPEFEIGVDVLLG